MLHFLQTLRIVMVVIAILVLLLILAITADLIYYHFIGHKKAALRAKQNRIRKEKEDDARLRGWYALDESPFLSGFDKDGQLNSGEWMLPKHRERGAHRPNRVTSLADVQIFKNTEDI
jgi:uncharacterized protein YxeA